MAEMHFRFSSYRRYFLSLYIWCAISTVKSVCVFEQFQYIGSLEGYNITSSILDVISKYDRMTRMDCANQCLTLDNCLSFFYNSLSNQCRFHTEVFHARTGATAQAGAQYFYLVRKEIPDETTSTTSTTTTETTTLTLVTTSIATPPPTTTASATEPTTLTLVTTTISIPPPTTTAIPFQCPTGDGFLTLGSDPDVMCIKFHTDQLAWSDANAYCSSYHPSGHLVVVNTAVKDTLVRDEGIFLDSQFDRGSFAIGLNIDGWVDGSPLVYTNWRPDVSFTSGSKECVTYHRNSGYKWNAVDCNLRKYFICQIPNE